MSSAHDLLENLSPEKRALFERLMRKKAEERRSASDLIPWEEPDWLGARRADLEARLSRLGLEASGPVTRFQASQDSCILCIPLADRHLYFKAVPRFFSCEIPLTLLLAEKFPQHVPVVLDSGKDWYLMDQLPGEPLTRSSDPEDWCVAMRDFARIQVALTEHRETLLRIGRANRELSRLMDRLDSFLARRDAACYSGVTVFDSLSEQRPKLERIVTRLEGFGLPPTLDHGDFHPHNIHLDAGRAIFFDFSDGSSSHPFFSPLALIGYLEHNHRHLIPRIDDLRDAYLEPWEELFPRDLLLDALTLCRPLATLHYILNMSECLADRPRPAPAESMDIRAAMTVCSLSISKDLCDPTEESVS